MFSSRIVRCSSPRPETRNTSVSPVSSTRSATLRQQLALQAIAQIARLVTYLPSRPGERRRVDLEVHRQRRLVDFDRRQRLRMLGIARASCRCRWSSMPVTSTMSPASACVDGTRSRPLNTETWFTLRVDRRDRSAFGGRAGRRRPGPGAMRPRIDAADAEAADVARIVERADLELQRTVGSSSRAAARARGSSRTAASASVVAYALWRRSRQRRPAVQRRRVDDREIELRFGRAQLVEELERLVDDPVRAARRDGRPC